MTTKMSMILRRVAEAAEEATCTVRFLGDNGLSIHEFDVVDPELFVVELMEIAKSMEVS